MSKDIFEEFDKINEQTIKKKFSLNYVREKMKEELAPQIEEVQKLKGEKK